MLKSFYIIIFLFKEFALEHVAFNVQNKFYVTFKHLQKKKNSIHLKFTLEPIKVIYCSHMTCDM